MLGSQRFFFTADFGREMNVGMLFDKSADHFFAFTALITIGSIKEVDAMSVCFFQSFAGNFGIKRCPPLAAQLPSTEGNFTDFVAGLPNKRYS